MSQVTSSDAKIFACWLFSASGQGGMLALPSAQAYGASSVFLSEEPELDMHLEKQYAQ